MQEEFINHLPKEIQRWVTQAVVGIVVSDGLIAPQESKHLSQLLSISEDAQFIQEMIKHLRNKSLPKLTPLQVSRDMATKILFYLALIIISDQRIAQTEVQYFRYAGGHLNVEYSILRMVTDWMQSLLLAQRKKDRVLKIIHASIPVYST